MQGKKQASTPASGPDDPSGDQVRGRRPFAAVAWEPLTPGGVARYAHATLNRLCLLQIVTAILSMVVVIWFLSTAFFPVVRDAIQQLPETGRMAFGGLESPIRAILPLAENSHLSIHLDLDNDHRPPTSHDLDLKLTQKGLVACTSFGCSFVAYPMGWHFPVNRTDSLAWWDAWSVMLLAMAGFGTVVGLMVTWWLLATLYCLVPRLVGFFGDRDITLGGAWRLSAAALVPGSVTMLFGMVCYGLGLFDWVHFLLVSTVHFAVPWLYLVAAPLQLPRRVAKKRPAAALDETNGDPEPPPKPNPFAGPDSNSESVVVVAEEEESADRGEVVVGRGGATLVQERVKESPEMSELNGDAEVLEPGEELKPASKRVAGNPFAGEVPKEVKGRRSKNPFA